MKTLIAMGFLSSILVFTSCQSNDIDPQKDLEGNWNIQSIQTKAELDGEDPLDETETFQGDESQITFSGDGTFTAQNFYLPEDVTEESVDVQGTYQVEGNVVILSFLEPENDVQLKMRFNTEVKKNTMTMTMTKEQFFLTLDDLAESDPFLRSFLGFYKGLFKSFSMTYKLTKA